MIYKTALAISIARAYRLMLVCCLGVCNRGLGMVSPSNPRLFELFQGIEPGCAVSLTSVYLVFDLGRDKNQIVEATDYLDAVDKFYELGRQYPIRKARVIGFYRGNAVTLCKLSPELLRKGNRLCGSNSSENS